MWPCVPKGSIFLHLWAREKHQLPPSLRSGILLPISAAPQLQPSPASCPPHPAAALTSGDTWPWARSMICAGGAAAARCLGRAKRAWYAESRLSVTADILREAVGDYKNSLPSLSPFLPLLSRAKSGSVCIMASKKGGCPVFRHTDLQPPTACFCPRVANAPWSWSLFPCTFYCHHLHWLN